MAGAGSCRTLLLRPLPLTPHLHPPTQTYVGNDDDPSCDGNPKASRLSTTFQAGVTYYIVIDGFSSGGWLESQGLYTLSITPSAAEER